MFIWLGSRSLAMFIIPKNSDMSASFGWFQRTPTINLLFWTVCLCQTTNDALHVGLVVFIYHIPLWRGIKCLSTLSFYFISTGVGDGEFVTHDSVHEFKLPQTESFLNKPEFILQIKFTGCIYLRCSRTQGGSI